MIKENSKGYGIDSLEFISGLLGTLKKIPLFVNERHLISFNDMRFFINIIEI